MTDLFTLAQISDSHLYADTEKLHYGANVFQNLVDVLTDIARNDSIDAIIFTGDLTHDHTEMSYQRFAEATSLVGISKPVYFTPGNHDEREYLTRHLQGFPFKSEKSFVLGSWQIVLLDSKGETPAGSITEQELKRLNAGLDVERHQLVFMHHHAQLTGFFIDRHALQERENFWKAIEKHNSIKAIACGHVHAAIDFVGDNVNRTPLHTCPATSIQFDPEADTVAALSTKPGYRLFELSASGQYRTSVHYME